MGSILICFLYFFGELVMNYLAVMIKNKRELGIPIKTQLKELIGKIRNKG